MIYLAHGSGLRAYDEWILNLSILAVVTVVVVLQLVKLSRRPEDHSWQPTDGTDGQLRPPTAEETRRANAEIRRLFD